MDTSPASLGSLSVLACTAPALSRPTWEPFGARCGGVALLSLAQKPGGQRGGSPAPTDVQLQPRVQAPSLQETHWGVHLFWLLSESPDPCDPPSPKKPHVCVCGM